MTICRHFGTCGGCAYQNMPEDAYRELKRSFIVEALAQKGFADVVVDQPIEVPPHTRRRASFKCAKRDGETLLGFHAARSHDIVDMLECLVLTPKLFALVAHLRELMAALLHEGEKADIHVTEADNGMDISLRWPRKRSSTLFGEIAQWAAAVKPARVTVNGEIATEMAPPHVRLGKAQIALPPEAFLQPTRDGEAALQAKVLAATKGAKVIADLFSGCGTFTFLLAAQSRVHAVEQDAPMLAALSAAARATQGLKPVTTEKRDLFKLPLGLDELKRFDAVVLDPPRAGALAQAKTLAQLKVKRIAYVSCNPESFARDARIMVDGGYRLGTVVPVDQFLWSSHIELVAAFSRG